MICSKDKILNYISGLDERKEDDAVRIFFNLLIDSSFQEQLHQNDVLHQHDAKKREKQTKKQTKFDKDYRKKKRLYGKYQSLKEDKGYGKVALRTWRKKKGIKRMSKPVRTFVPARHKNDYSTMLKELLNEGFIRKSRKMRGRQWYTAQSKIIKTLVRHIAFSEKDAEIVEETYLNPIIPKHKERLRSGREIFKPHGVKEGWWVRINNMLNKPDEVEFMDMFLMDEEEVLDQCRYYDVSLPVSEYLKGQEGISRFLRDQIISRMNAEPKIQKRDRGTTFYNKQLLTHLIILPYIKRDNNEIPFDRVDNALGIKLPDCSLATYWKDVIDFIHIHKNDHFIPELLGRGWDQTLTTEFYGYIGQAINNLERTKSLILQEIPFKIQITNKSDTTIRKLKELQEHLDKP